jgi:hypothetical protein
MTRVLRKFQETEEAAAYEAVGGEGLHAPPSFLFDLAFAAFGK